MVEKNYKLNLFDHWGVRVEKAPALEQSMDAPEEELNEEAISMPTNLIQTIKRLLIQLNKKLSSLIIIRLWT